MRDLLSLFPLVLMLALPRDAHAQFTFSTNNNALTITRYLGNATVLAIPEATNGYPITSIGEGAFGRRSSLTSVLLPDSIVTIGDGAFYSCSGLTTINLPPNLTSIGASTFNGCRLTTVFIPQSVSNIGSRAFAGCSTLEQIAVDDLNPHYCDLDGILFDRSQTMLIQCPPRKSGSYVVPDTVTSIGESSFSDSAFYSIDIQDGVTDLGSYAFRDATTLTNICIPETVTNIGARAFSGCSSLRSVSIPDGVTTIGTYTFSWCTGLTELHIGRSVTSIGVSAFYDCSGLTQVSIPDSVTNIGMQAFIHCSGLRNVYVGEGVANIGDAAFLGCVNLAGIFFTGNAPSVGSSVFGYSSVTVYFLPPTTGWGPTFGGRPTAIWTQPPEVLAQPQDTSVNVGETAQFSVVAESPLDLSYQWLVNGAPIRGGTSAALDLPDVQLADAGAYAVVISNQLGSVTSSNAFLWVNVVDIKANGMNGFVVLGRGEPLTVTASLVIDPTLVGDTWILAMTPEGFPLNIFSYYLDWNSWVPWLFTLYSPSAQGAIPLLESETLLQSSGLPGGFYIFYLGYDPVQNRRIDFDNLEIDAVTVIIVN